MAADPSRSNRERPAMLVDLHAHYPMHIHPRARCGRLQLLRARAWVPWRLRRTRRAPNGFRDRLRGYLIDLASLFINYRSIFSGPRVRMKYMREGEVGVALSVLYSFFDEVDALDGVTPKAAYIDTLLDQIETITAHVAELPAGIAEVAGNRDELAGIVDRGEIAVVHCVEGGFHLGADPDQVAGSVAELAAAGVAYITLAHLIWRDVATDAPALPFMTDDQYEDWFPQPPIGLSPLGEAAVRAMVDQHVLIDVSHMSTRALDATFELLDELDDRKEVPVLASHTGYRFGEQEYMLDQPTIERIADRNGVIGLIFAQHQLYDGLFDLPSPPPGAPTSKPTDFNGSFEVLRLHIDRIHEITGSHLHTAIGSDLDGFIKPTLPGLADMRDMARLQEALRAEYEQADAEAICSGNALRLLRSYWGATNGGK